MRITVLFLVLALILSTVPTKAASPAKAKDGWVFHEYVRQESDEPLPGTALLTWKQDYSAVVNAGVDRFLLRETEKTRLRRQARWNHGAKTLPDYQRFVAPLREKLAKILGAVDARRSDSLLFSGEGSGAVPGKSYRIRDVRWNVFDDYVAEGIMVDSAGRVPRRLLIVIPHCGMDPRAYFQSVPYLSQLADKGEVRMIIPAIIGREPIRMLNRPVNYPAREALFQSAFEVGRHVIGYEVETVRALIDLWNREGKRGEDSVHVAGYGEGGMIALYSAALDTRIHSVSVAGYFDRRETMWQQPMDRNVFGLLNDFGDAELAAMVFPRKVLIESGRGPEETIAPKITEAFRGQTGDRNQKPVKYACSSSAPGRLESPRPEDVVGEIARARRIVATLAPDEEWIRLVTDGDKAALGSFTPAPDSTFVQTEAYRAQQNRIFTQTDRHTQYILAGCWATRAKFMSKLDYRSLNAYEKSTDWYRDYFYKNVIGRFDLVPLPFNARSRKAFDEKNWTGYDVVLDVFEHVSAQGLLIVPKGIQAGQRLPVVVYQHGLEGRPEGGIHRSNQILVRLVQRGYVVFAPQDIYAGGDAFRTLQRKARPLGKTLYSIIIPQHQQITDWLGSLPFVDKERIGFYGISYGGKTAMRVPAVVTNYALSICSGDFSDWVYRVASSREPFSYIGIGEYEIPEFDLGSTFNHAEMAALIAPRPFMVERGHFDGCGRDEHVASEYAKVRFLYEAKLKIANRTNIEWFVGGHEINAAGTVQFLDRWLQKER